MLSPAELEEVITTAIAVGLANQAKRSLLFGYTPIELRVELEQAGLAPGDQLRSDVQSLAQRQLPHFATWLENAERLSRWHPEAVSVFAGARRRLEGRAQIPSPSRLATEAISLQFFAGRTDLLDVGRELRDIKARLEASVAGPRLHISDVRTAAEVDSIFEALHEGDTQVVHVSTHGKEGGTLVFQTRQGGPHDVPGSLFARMIATENRARRADNRIRLVVLSACHSDPCAAALVAVGDVDAAIGLTEKISDPAAIAFAVTFYRAIADMRSVQNAFEAGCLRVESLGPTYVHEASHFRLHAVAPELYLIPE